MTKLTPTTLYSFWIFGVHTQPTSMWVLFFYQNLYVYSYDKKKIISRYFNFDGKQIQTLLFFSLF